MPTRPIDNELQMYHATQNAFGTWKTGGGNTVTLRDYIGYGPTAGPWSTKPHRNNNTSGDAAQDTISSATFPTNAGLGCYAMTLEKSSTLAQSGSPISASRDLNVVFGPTSLPGFKDQIVPLTAADGAEAVGTLWGGFYVDVFVPYVTLVTVYMDSILTRS
jgi:hypothetical protein